MQSLSIAALPKEAISALIISPAKRGSRHLSMSECSRSASWRQLPPVRLVGTNPDLDECIGDYALTYIADDDNRVYQDLHRSVESVASG